ncbi:MAG: Crp/Fnr family transcriptional regulator [Myxococcota bacterium]|nr:Crp/Fnr family transcriptional regulator [Myxococcota bacterium]
MSQLLSHEDMRQALPPPIVETLRGKAVRKRFSDGDWVFRVDSPIEGFWGVVSGQLAVVAHGADGREVVLTYLGPGEWFGEISLLDDLPRTHGSRAKGDTELLLVPRREFKALLEQDPGLYRAIALLLCQRLRLAFGLIEDSLLRDLPSRLAKRLLELAKDHGRGSTSGVAIGLHLPQEEIGTLLGATREAVSKHLKRFEREGWIRLARGRVEITDAESLRRLLDLEPASVGS